MTVMTDPDTTTLTQTVEATDLPWTVIVFDDPVNLIDYVTFVLMRIFGYDESKAYSLTMEVHKLGKSIVWAGAREKAEFYVQQLQSHQLKSTLEKL